MYSNLKMM